MKLVMIFISLLLLAVSVTCEHKESGGNSVNPATPGTAEVVDTSAKKATPANDEKSAATVSEGKGKTVLSSRRYHSSQADDGGSGSRNNYQQKWQNKPRASKNDPYYDQQESDYALRNSRHRRGRNSYYDDDYPIHGGYDYYGGRGGRDSYYDYYYYDPRERYYDNYNYPRNYYDNYYYNPYARRKAYRYPSNYENNYGHNY